MDESIKYRLRTSRDGTRSGPVVRVGWRWIAAYNPCAGTA